MHTEGFPTPEPVNPDDEALSHMTDHGGSESADITLAEGDEDNTMEQVRHRQDMLDGKYVGALNELAEKSAETIRAGRIVDRLQKMLYTYRREDMTIPIQRVDDPVEMRRILDERHIKLMEITADRSKLQDKVNYIVKACLAAVCPETLASLPFTDFASTYKTLWLWTDREANPWDFSPEARAKRDILQEAFDKACTEVDMVIDLSTY